jgi:hypothetical protein
MIIPDDIYRQTSVQELADGKTHYGTVHLTYEVRQITDVRNLGTARRYRLTCTQRLVVPNLNDFVLAPQGVTKYQDYPALLLSSFALNLTDQASVQLLSYSPRTLNSSVSTARNEGQGDTQSVSRQHTSGSSTSETNSYSVNASFGFFGLDPTGSGGIDYTNSETNENNQSTSRGSDHGSSQETGSSESMSIKDWASYAYLSGTEPTVPAWVWAQEYPWDVIQFRDCGPDNSVKLPEFVASRMFDPPSAPTSVLAPSVLSQFGVDFTMKAAWLVTPPPAEDQFVQVNHAIQYGMGSHGLDGTTPYVRFRAATPLEVLSPVLHLTELGLDPLDGSGSGAVTGFAANKFIAGPNEGALFKILSDENTLQVTGTGFDTAMVSGFTKGPVTLTLKFKVVDAEFDYTLFLKNWKTGDASSQLELVINGDGENPVYRHVDSLEGEGGDDNLTTVTLRNKDYTSIDYHDYLVMGMNTIQINITPGSGTSAGYVLRALAIGGS